ncbi:MAG: SMC family ATPase [Saprospiraceae bacterium]|nr:SMC family ATPase [Saprospiraceae bacterium]
MILQSLFLENYKQYGRLELPFREGLVGIIGKNGAGKSTLFEAILYCLYGKDEIAQKDLIRASFADPKAAVKLRLEFTIGDVLYSIRRELRGRKLETVVAELYKNDELIAKGANPVTEQVTRLLSLDREAFKHSVFSGQKELTELSETTGQGRRQLIRRMLGLERLDDIQKAVNSDMNARRNEIAGQRKLLLEPEVVENLTTQKSALETQLEDFSQRLAAENDRKAALEDQYKNAKARFDQEAVKQRQHLELDKRLGELQERMDNWSEQTRVQTAKIESLRKTKTDWALKEVQVKSYAPMKQALHNLEEAQHKKINADARTKEISETAKLLSECTQRKQALERDLAAIAPAAIRLEATEQTIRELESLLEQKVEEHRTLSAQLKSLDDRIAERHDKINALQTIGREGACPTCFQPLLHAYDEVLAQLTAELSDWTATEKNKLEAQLQQLLAEGQALRAQASNQKKEQLALRDQVARLPDLERQLRQEEQTQRNLEQKRLSTQKILDEIGDVRFDEQQLRELKRQFKSVEQLHQSWLQDTAHVQRELPNAEKALLEAKKHIGEARAEQQEVQSKQQAVGFQAERYDQARALADTLDKQFREQYDLLNRLIGEQQAVRQKWQSANERLEQHLNVGRLIAENQSELDVLEKLSELFKSFKNIVLERVSPGISQYAGELFSRITKGKYEGIRVDQNFEFSIADAGAYYPIERFSGGEIDLANFCLRIAVTRSIMELNGNGRSVEFLAFDEIFGSQDEERRHEMMLALNLLQEQFRQIYIISHIESQKDYYPNILEIRAGAQGSVATWI